MVSVIIPSYNNINYLKIAVDSALNQSYSDIEVIIIDDGSSDGSLDLAYSIEKQDRRVKVLTHDNKKNKGVSATRNLGLRFAKGEYIALLDSDDLWYPNKIQRQLSVLNKEKDIGLLYSNLITRFDVQCQGFPALCGSGPEGLQANVFNDMVKDLIWMPNSSVIFRKDILREVGGFNEQLKYQIEDHLFFTVCSYYYKTYYLKEVLGEYRIHNSSYTVNTNWKNSFYEYWKKLLLDSRIRSKRVILKAIVRKLLKDMASIFKNKDNN